MSREIDCMNCNGSGYVLVHETEQLCCGNTTKYGSCCGKSIIGFIDKEEQCPECGATGKIKLNQPINHNK